MWANPDDDIGYRYLPSGNGCRKPARNWGSRRVTSITEARSDSMAKSGNRAAIGALILGGLAVIAPRFLYGTQGLGGYGGLSGGYGGMMGAYGGMMGGYGGMMGGYGGMMGGYGSVGTVGTAGTIVALVGQLGFLLLLVGGAYLLYRAFVGAGSGSQFGTTDTAMEELRLAYARGDLSEEEFETRRAPSSTER